MFEALSERNDLIKMIRTSRVIQFSAALLIIMFISVYYSWGNIYSYSYREPLFPILNKAFIFLGIFLCSPGLLTVDLFPNMPSEYAKIYVKTSGYLFALLIFIGIYAFTRLVRKYSNNA